MTNEISAAEPSRPPGPGHRRATRTTRGRHTAVGADLPRAAAGVQLDLFGQVETAIAAQAAATAAATAREDLRRAFTNLMHHHPGTGADLGHRLWCGRCGGVEANSYLIVINHELGWLAGCYARFRPGTVSGPFDGTTEAQRADRWDRQFFADCHACGHPWGLHPWELGGGSHDERTGCHALRFGRCRCTGYQQAAATDR